MIAKLATAVLVLAVTACGGGSGDDAPCAGRPLDARPTMADAAAVAPDAAADAAPTAPDAGIEPDATIPPYVADLPLAGHVHREGQGVPVDHPRGAREFKRACDRGVADACYALALANANGEGIPVAADRWLPLLERACKLGDGSACLRAAVDTPTAADRDRLHAAARALYEQSCTAGRAGACATLAFAHRDGKWAPVDAALRDSYTARAVELGEPACAAGRTVSCETLAHIHQYFRSDLDRAAIIGRFLIAILTKACDADDPRACDELGYRLAYPPHGVAKDEASSIRAYAKACAARFAQSCAMASYATRDGDEEIRFKIRACDLGDPQACLGAAVHLRMGNLPERASEADAFERRGKRILAAWCRAGDAEACRDRGMWK